MMRQNLALVVALALATAASSASAGEKAKTGHRKLDQMSTTKDRWDELMNGEQLEDDKPKREITTVLRPATMRPAAPRSRMPASVAPMQAAPRPAVFPAGSITFDEYLAENGRNPVLSKKIPDRQLAFTDTAAPAVITIPGSESETQSASAAGAAPQPGAAGGLNPAALQSAAAAAAAAGLIPNGSMPSSGSVGGAGGGMQTGATGTPNR